jgi:hypothetical protein
MRVKTIAARARRLATVFYKEYVNHRHEHLGAVFG